MKIKEVSEKYNVPMTALRYYEKAGLFNQVKRVNGIREYDDLDIERLSLILTLKKANIDVLTDGIGRGQSIVDINGHWNDGRCNAWYAAEVDVNKFYKLLLTTIFEEKKEEILEYLNR